jgi:hypothetical protein
MCRNSHSLEQRQLRWVLPYYRDVIGLAREHLRTQIAEPSIAEHDDAIGASDAHLRRDLKRRGERLGEDGDVRIDVVGNPMQVAFGNGQVFRESAVVFEDTEHGPRGTVTRPSPQARVTCPAAAVDLTDDALAGEAPRCRHADELVPEHASKALVAADKLQVGLADAGAEHAHEDFASEWSRVGAIHLHADTIVVQNERTHS